MKVFLTISLSILLLLQCENGAESKTPLPPDSAVKTETKTEIKPSATPKNEKKMDKQKLAERVKPIDERASAIILDEQSQIEEIPAPFLKNGQIRRVSKFAPTRPIQIYVGTVEPDYAAIITGDAEKYFEFVRKAGVVADNDRSRLEYFKNFLQIVNAGKRLQIVENVDEIKERPNLDDAQKVRFAEFRKNFAKIITAPKRGENGSYDIFAVKDQSLVKFTLTLKEDKSIETKETVLEKELLIPYAL